MTLDQDDIEAIAEHAAHRVVQLLDRPEPVSRLRDPSRRCLLLRGRLAHVTSHTAYRSRWMSSLGYSGK